MRQLNIITIGKIKPSAKYLEAGIKLYQDRLSRRFKITWTELPEATPTATYPVERVMQDEAERILKLITPQHYSVLWNERGKLMDSRAFASWLGEIQNPLDGGRGGMDGNRMIWIVGGANGTAPSLDSHVSAVFSLSPLTFPHQMVRLLLMEQLYRAVTLLNNEPYHK